MFVIRIPRWMLILGGLVCGVLLLFILSHYLWDVPGSIMTQERTFAIIKPDAVRALHTGKIIDRIEAEGFTICAMKKILLDKDQARKFYGVHKDRAFYKDLVTFMTSGSVVVMVLAKNQAIKAWRDLMGATDPAKAQEGTLRKLYGSSISENAVHGSDAPETAVQEIAFFFPEL